MEKDKNSGRPVLEVAAEGGPKRALQATIFFFLRWVVEKDKNSGRLALEGAVEGGPKRALQATIFFFLRWEVEKDKKIVAGRSWKRAHGARVGHEALMLLGCHYKCIVVVARVAVPAPRWAREYGADLPARH